MNRKRSSSTLRLSKRIAWRIRSLISKSDWQRWKSRKIGQDVSSKYRELMMTVWLTRTTWERRRRKKSCRWRSWRWSWSRSFRILKLCRRRHTRSLSVPLKSLPPWWPHTVVNLLQAALHLKCDTAERQWESHATNFAKSYRIFVCRKNHISVSKQLD